MCGITGWIDWDVDLTQQQHILDVMVETMANRGPDDSGTWLSERAALGHRRLSVVDPVGGGQPMTRQVGDNIFVVIYNGELYNTPELRHELELKGHHFKTHSDTEVLLVSYIEWGQECVKKFNGIFAFAVWNDKEQQLFMARDRLGVKPLFYTRRGNTLYFGSELKALLAHPAVNPEIDLEGLAEIFGLGPARTPGHGVFRGIQELRPGFSLLYNRQGLQISRYWALTSQPHPDDLDTTVARVRELVEDSVSRQLVADVPVCTLLSGGLDSSTLSAFAAKNFQTNGLPPLHTYSIDYVGNDHYFKPNKFQPNSDADWVDRVSDFLGTRHHKILIDTPQLVAALTDATLARDLPCMADVDSSLLLFCREIKQGATVALSGECADEIFGGYPWFHREELMNSKAFPWSPSALRRAGVINPEIREKVNLPDYVMERYQETLSEVPRLPGEDPLEARRRELFYLNITWFMSNLLDRKDRMSMATGLEVRVPFCDHRLVEYVWNIPWSMKSCDQIEKGILRRALKGVLPDDVLYRHKSPYPKTHNPAYLAATRQCLEEIINDPASPLLALIDLDNVRELIRTDGESFGTSWYGQLMGGAQLFAYLAQIDTWLRKYKVVIR